MTALNKLASGEALPPSLPPSLFLSPPSLSLYRFSPPQYQFRPWLPTKPCLVSFFFLIFIFFYLLFLLLFIKSIFFFYILCIIRCQCRHHQMRSSIVGDGARYSVFKYRPVWGVLIGSEVSLRRLMLCSGCFSLLCSDLHQKKKRNKNKKKNKKRPPPKKMPLKAKQK